MYIDCDVIQADGGTRTASITGAFIAMMDAFRSLKEEGIVKKVPVRDFVSAISTGIVRGNVLLDLDYKEDSTADVDMNFVMTGSGRFIEVQGTAEQTPFDRDQFNEMADVAAKGISGLTKKQVEIFGDIN
jgi:ribonuclease PH